MDELLRKVDARIKVLDRELKKAEREQGNFPEGKLRISCSGKQERYYLVDRERGMPGKYISQSQRKLIMELAQKRYNSVFLKVAGLERKRLGFIRSLMNFEAAESVYDNLSSRRKSLISPYMVSDQVFAKQWQEQKYKTTEYKLENRVFQTRRGEMVRSKSEVILADLLADLDIPYHYEKPLKHKNGAVRYPDFTLLDVKERSEVYLEHFGMMDDPDYLKGALKKMDEYRENGIYPGKNMIVTYETRERPLDIKGIKSMIGEIFGK